MLAGLHTASPNPLAVPSWKASLFTLRFTWFVMYPSPSENSQTQCKITTTIWQVTHFVHEWTLVLLLWPGPIKATPRANNKGIPSTDTLVELIIFSKPAPSTHTDSHSERFKQELLNFILRQIILGTIKPAVLKTFWSGHSQTRSTLATLLPSHLLSATADSS